MPPEFELSSLMEPIVTEPASNGTTAQAPSKRGRHPKDCACPIHAGKASGGKTRPTIVRDTPPKRTAKKSAVTTPRASLETRIGSFLMQINLGMMVVCNMVPGMTKDDPLTPAEISVLAKSISAEAQAHPAFKRYLENFLAVSTAGQLYLVIGMIIGRRLARRSILLPPIADNMIGIALADPEGFGEMLAGMMAQNVTPDEAPSATENPAA